MEQIGNYITSPNKLQVDEKMTESTELAREMYAHFGKESGRKIYPLFHSARYTHRQIKDAWNDYQKGSIKGIKFFMWKLNRTR